MRTIKKIDQNGHFKIVDVDLTENEQLAVQYLKNSVFNSIDFFVYEMVQYQKSNKRTQEMTDFIKTIAYISIDSMQFETKYAPTDHEAKRMLITNNLILNGKEWREKAKTHLYAIKAKAIGINVTVAEVDAWMDAQDCKSEDDVDERIIANAKLTYILKKR